MANAVHLHAPEMSHGYGLTNGLGERKLGAGGAAGEGCAIGDFARAEARGSEVRQWFRL